MKKIMTAVAVFACSSFAFAQFHDPNAPMAKPEKTHHEMKHEHKGKKHEKHHGGFFDESQAVKTVAALKEAKDDSLVLLQGKIVKQVGKDDFLFQDATGEVEVEVNRRAWHGQTITPNDVVEIRGKVDKDWDKTDVEVKHVIKK